MTIRPTLMLAIVVACALSALMPPVLAQEGSVPATAPSATAPGRVDGSNVLTIADLPEEQRDRLAELKAITIAVRERPAGADRTKLARAALEQWQKIAVQMPNLLDSWVWSARLAIDLDEAAAGKVAALRLVDLGAHQLAGDQAKELLGALRDKGWLPVTSAAPSGTLDALLAALQSRRVDLVDKPDSVVVLAAIDEATALVEKAKAANAAPTPFERRAMERAAEQLIELAADDPVRAAKAAEVVVKARSVLCKSPDDVKALTLTAAAALESNDNAAARLAEVLLTAAGAENATDNALLDLLADLRSEEVWGNPTKPSGAVSRAQTPAQSNVSRRPAPDFTLQTLDDGTVTLSELKGLVVVLEFWASWCGPCKAALPKLQEFADWANESDRSVKIYAVNVGEVRADVERFWREKGYSMTVLLAPYGSVDKEYSVNAFPKTVVIDHDGNILREHTGFDWNMATELQKDIQTLLGDQAQPSNAVSPLKNEFQPVSGLDIEIVQDPLARWSPIPATLPEAEFMVTQIGKWRGVGRDSDGNESTSESTTEWTADRRAIRCREAFNMLGSKIESSWYLGWNKSKACLEYATPVVNPATFEPDESRGYEVSTCQYASGSKTLTLRVWQQDPLPVEVILVSNDEIHTQGQYKDPSGQIVDMHGTYRRVK